LQNFITSRWFDTIEVLRRLLDWTRRNLTSEATRRLFQMCIANTLYLKKINLKIEDVIISVISVDGRALFGTSLHFLRKHLTLPNLIWLYITLRNVT
jgi:hypothetical protein